MNPKHPIDDQGQTDTGPRVTNEGMTNPSAWRQAQRERRHRLDAQIWRPHPDSVQAGVLQGKDPQCATNRALDRLGAYLNTLETDILKSAQDIAAAEGDEAILDSHIQEAIVRQRERETGRQQKRQRLRRVQQGAILVTGAVLSQALTVDYWTTYPLTFKIAIFFLGIGSAWMLVYATEKPAE